MASIGAAGPVDAHAARADGCRGPRGSRDRCDARPLREAIVEAALQVRARLGIGVDVECGAW